MTSNPPVPDPNYSLNDAAKKEIADAIAMVREDRFEKWVRENLSAFGGKKPDDGPNPPPPKPNDPPNPEGEPKKIGLWGSYAE